MLIQNIVLVFIKTLLLLIKIYKIPVKITRNHHWGIVSPGICLVVSVFSSIFFDDLVALLRRFRMIYNSTWRSKSIAHNRQSTRMCDNGHWGIYVHKILMGLLGEKASHIDLILVLKNFWDLMWLFHKKKMRFFWGDRFPVLTTPFFGYFMLFSSVIKNHCKVENS